jgi:hypothetical protein
MNQLQQRTHKLYETVANRLREEGIEVSPAIVKACFSNATDWVREQMEQLTHTQIFWVRFGTFYMTNSARKKHGLEDRIYFIDKDGNKQYRKKLNIHHGTEEKSNPSKIKQSGQSND